MSLKNFGITNRLSTAAGLRGSNDAGVNSSVILRIASDLMNAPSFVTNTMELISSAFLPLASSNDRPTLDCNAENRSLPFGSQSSATLTAALHMLHTVYQRGKRKMRK
mmetsp:Transcript_21098/g.37958  ORF Transcript_21098/g.37958 Transcript_21098/m.37958 type:complete len:108 (+) Transcript_21098:170-493(+)